MNWKQKAFTFGSIASLGICPTMSIISSCSKNDDDILNSITQDISTEFTWICGHYRQSYYNREFCHELVKRIKSMGYTVKREWDEENWRPLPFEEKDPETGVVIAHHYRPEEEADDTVYGKTPFGYDICFDIPANTDDATYPKIILQAHTDMVCSVRENPETKKPYDYDWSLGTIPVIEDGWMHSKDKLTSLGADDGAGVAIILSIARHAKEFKHGLIRCIFTVDEEDGPTGAKYLPDSWFDGIDYYLNLDAEHVHINWNQSAGSQQTAFAIESAEFEDPEQAKEYHISISGLPEGHSGLDIDKNHMNAIIVMGQILDKMLKESVFDEDTLRLTLAYENNSRKLKSTCGQLTKAIDFWVKGVPKSTTTLDTLTKLVTDRVELTHKEGFIQNNEDDKPVVSVVEETKEMHGKDSGITPSLTKQLATMLSDYQNNKIYSYNKTEGQKTPISGCYTGCIRTGDSFWTSTFNKNTLYVEFFARSLNTADLDQYQKEIFPKAIQPFAGEGKLESIFYSNPWTHDSNNKLQRIIHNASDHYENELEDETVFAWMEISEVVNKHPDIYYGAIGPEIEKVHTPDERLQVSTISTMTKLLVYILQHLEKKD